MSTGPRLALRALFALALVAAAACENAEHALLIRAQSVGDVETLDVLVARVSDAGLVGERVHWVRGRRVNRRAVDLQEEPLRVAVSLPGPGDYMVHLLARGTGKTFSASRCYSVSGVERDSVVLTDITSTDADGDGFVVDPGPGCTDFDDSAFPSCRNACTGGADADCNDEAAGIFPGAPEICANGVDEACDGTGGETCADRDGDEFIACGPASDPSACDCDDGNAEVFPGAPSTSECVAGFDLDCDGAVSECDLDNDGAARCPYGSKSRTCDCNDDDATIGPGAEEKCTPEGEVAIDENCNGFFDEAAACTPDDLDLDGFPDCARAPERPDCDCNDCDPGVNRGANEACGNGIDEDCVGGDADCDPGDTDEDGYPAAQDCDDTMASVYPGAPERCGDNIAQDCGPGAGMGCTSDADGDEYNDEDDCDPNDSTVNPGAVETCDNVDNDCDGTPNESLDANRGCIPATAARACGPAALFCPVDTRTDIEHCGACRRSCLDELTPPANGRLTCENGVCGSECVSGTLCSDNLRCANQALPATCGPDCVNCDDTMNAPTGGFLTCSGGECGLGCANGLQLCMGGLRCADQTSPDSCGADCESCDAGPNNSERTCVSGACGWSCNAGFKRCGDVCVPTATTTCAPGGGAVCSVCMPGPGQSNDGCSSTTCQYKCDVQGYRSCGGVCAECPALTPGMNREFACSGNACVEQCASGYRACATECVQNAALRDTCGGDTCLDLTSDTANCGACGVACGTGETCVDGRCDCDGAQTGDPGDGPYCTDVGDVCCASGSPRCRPSCD